MKKFSPGAILLAVLSCLLGAAPATYDQLQADFKPYLSLDDPSAFAMKIRAASSSPRALWGGGKELFFAWCKDHSGDWLRDPTHFVPSHGDVHLGNIGAYPSSTALGDLAFGLVDFDDASSLPVEFDLLEACVSLRVMATHARIELSSEEHLALCRVVVESFIAAEKSDQNTGDLLRDDPQVASTFAHRGKKYSSELEHFTTGGHFRRTIEKKGELTEILRPANDRANSLAIAIARAGGKSERFKSLLRTSDPKQLAPAIKDVALRTHVASAGSQGLEKILILLDKPLRGVDHDVIFYLKQQIPSAAERAGISAGNSTGISQSPGQRVRDAIDAMNDPRPFINEVCECDGKSYSLMLKEPWGGELSEAAIASADDLHRAAMEFGTVLGAAHRSAKSDLAPDLAKALDQRASAYLATLISQFESLRDDPRTAKRVAEADAWIERMRKESH